MEAYILHPHPIEEILKAAARLKGHLVADFTIPKRAQYGNQRLRQGPGKSLLIAALRRGISNRAAVEVDVAHDEHRLAEAAPCVEANVKRQAHPFLLNVFAGFVALFERLKATRNLLVGQLALFLRRVLFDAEPLQRVCLDLPTECGLTENLPEHLNLKQGPIFRACFLIGHAARSPAYILVAVFVGDILRVINSGVSEPMTNVPPMEPVGVKRLFRGAMTDEPLVNPAPIVPPRRSVLLFRLLERPFSANHLCFRRLSFVLVVQFSGGRNPFSLHLPPQPPKGRIRTFVEGCHFRSVTM